jgi:hypothetical protein
MPLPATIPQVIVDTILNPLALLFFAAAGNLTAARHAADQMLAAYNVQSEDELILAAEIIGFRLHALDALSQAADPDMSLNHVLRLRGSAVSLSREAHKSQRKLDQLQRARTKPQPAEAAPEPPKPEIQPQAPRTASTPHTFQKSEAARRITDNLRKNQSAHLSAAQSARPIAETPIFTHP